jgi:hypothetical protein
MDETPEPQKPAQQSPPPASSPPKLATEIKNVSAVEKQKLLQMSEISLWLDTYDDIFSDFDPRPFSHRSLSQDFLQEAKRASIDKAGETILLQFLIPAKIRVAEHESMIKKRLRDHFKKHYHVLMAEAKRTTVKGVFLTAVGTLMILGATYIYPENTTGFFQRLAFVVLEPSGWFISWVGLENVFHSMGQRKPDIEFYKKMSACEIQFVSY